MTTWTAAVDLRTAFDSVSREAIFHILSRYGFPPHFISILKRFHTGTKLQGRVGAAEYEVQTKAGVRTGDTCGPDLFNICMMAIAELTVWPVNTVPEFRTSKYLNEEVEAFKMASVQYADDCILFSNTRKGLAKMVMAFKKTAKAVTGMCMHDAASQFPLPKDMSKTVCMVCPPPGVEYKDLDTTPLKLQEEDEETASYVHFEESVSYLGIIIHFDLGPTHAMKKRIALASARNWQYRGILNNRAFDAKVKGSILTATVLPMLLYGSDVWNPTVTQLKKSVSSVEWLLPSSAQNHFENSTRSPHKKRNGLGKAWSGVHKLLPPTQASKLAGENSKNGHEPLAPQATDVGGQSGPQ